MTAALKIVMTLKPVSLIAQQGYSGGFGKCFFSLFFLFLNYSLNHRDTKLPDV